jgi:cation transport regulator
MPYLRNSDLPSAVRSHLPNHAQDIFRSAFNSACDGYRGKEPNRIDEIARRVAWAAVKKRYRKVGDAWVVRANAR